MPSIQNLTKQVRQQQKEIQHLQNLVERDALTGLLNRTGFMQRANEYLGEMKKRGEHHRKLEISNFAILFIDIDKFKDINDRWGHNVGDSCLKEVGSVLEKSVRDLDIVGRWSGDEFVVGLVGADYENGQMKAEYIFQRFEKARAKRMKKYPLPGVSIGVAAVGERKGAVPSIETLIKKADKRMYQMKG